MPCPAFQALVVVAEAVEALRSRASEEEVVEERSGLRRPLGAWAVVVVVEPRVQNRVLEMTGSREVLLWAS